MLVLLQYRLWFGDGNIPDLKAYQNNVDALQGELHKQQQMNRTLEAEIKDLKNGLEGVEERARRSLGMIKKGETFFQVIEEPSE